MTGCWPELPVEALAADFVFFDADLGFDEQFPWKPGEAPMPLVALIGSEAPGRIEWALSHNADAQLLKPVGNAGVYSALLIARQSFEARKHLAGEIASLRQRVAERQTIVRAVAALSQGRRGRPRLCAAALAGHGLADQHRGGGAPHRGDDAKRKAAMTSPIAPELSRAPAMPAKARAGVWRRLLQAPAGGARPGRSSRSSWPARSWRRG